MIAAFLGNVDVSRQKNRGRKNEEAKEETFAFSQSNNTLPIFSFFCK